MNKKPHANKNVLAQLILVLTDAVQQEAPYYLTWELTQKAALFYFLYRNLGKIFFGLGP